MLPRGSHIHRQHKINHLPFYIALHYNRPNNMPQSNNDNDNGPFTTTPSPRYNMKADIF